MDPDEHERHATRAAEAGMSRRELAALTNLSDDRVQQILDDLVGSGEARQAETHSA